MSQRHSLAAYVATLVAIIILVGIGAWLAATGAKYEALGVGGAVTGLIGIAGTFKTRPADAAAGNGE